MADSIAAVSVVIAFYASRTQAKVVLRQLEQTSSDAGVELTFIVYPGATHSWTNPEADRNAQEFKMPVAYNPEMDRKSWEDLQDFLKEIFAKR